MDIIDSVLDAFQSDANKGDAELRLSLSLCSNLLPHVPLSEAEKKCLSVHHLEENLK